MQKKGGRGAGGGEPVLHSSLDDLVCWPSFPGLSFTVLSVDHLYQGIEETSIFVYYQVVKKYEWTLLNIKMCMLCDSMLCRFYHGDILH